MLDPKNLKDQSLELAGPRQDGVWNMCLIVCKSAKIVTFCVILHLTDVWTILFYRITHVSGVKLKLDRHYLQLLSSSDDSYGDRLIEKFGT